MRLAALALVLGACGGTEGDFIIVTIDTRPAVHDIGEIVVTLTNDGTSLEDRFTVSTQTFPATFSIQAPGRTGTLGISIDANDRDGLLVGRGATATTVETPTASVMLDSADFVVNTEFADDQFPSDDFEANGFQIAAAPDGTWTVAYRDRCLAPCTMFARRFDRDGRPIESEIAAGTNGFAVSTALTTGLATPAVAMTAQTTVVVWDFSEPSPSTVDGVACRAFDAAGAPLGNQVPVSIESLPDVVSVTALSSGSFAVSWNGFMTNNTIKSAIVDASCQPGAVVQVNQQAGTLGANRGAVAANGNSILYAWILDGDVHGRIADLNNSFPGPEFPIVVRNATEKVEHVRVTQLADGFAVVVRWALDGQTTGAGRIEMYRVNAGGQLLGSPTLVTTRSGSDFNSKKSFGVAHRADGALLVVWHACEENGDGSGCGVFGRVLRPSGVPVGDELEIATTTELDQTNPAAVGLADAFAVTWKDDSGKSPDRSGSSARARVLYPPYDDAARVLGARCLTTNDCDGGLVCGVSSDGGSRCFAPCDPVSAPPQCPGGGTCALASGANACLF